MKLFDGRDTLEFERSGDTIAVMLTGGQLRMTAIDVVRRHVAIADQTPEEYQAVLEYTSPAASRSFLRASAEAKTLLDRLRLAQRLSSLRALAGRFRVPFLHPENLVVTGAGVVPIHSGLTGILVPMEFDAGLFLRGYKALAVSVFHPRLPFEKLIDGASVLRDSLSRRIVACESVDEVIALIDAELAAESAKAGRRLVSVPKMRYRLLAGACALALVAAGVCGWFAYTSYVVTQPRQEAIVAAQSRFVTTDYAGTLGALEHYSPAELPKSARYVLAVSAVELSDLTGVQKQAVLGTLSTKTDDNSLDYWIFLARGELERAVDLAQNLGDDQLTLLAYTELYQATKLNSAMEGARKQKLLEDYAKKIEELTARLGGTDKGAGA